MTKRRIRRFLLFLLVALLLWLGISQPQEGNSGGDGFEAGLSVHFIDVGQGDAALVVVDGEFMLIDGGPGSAEKDLLRYLTAQRVGSLRYVIATHPHEDHIGGLPAVLERYSVGTLLMPDATANTNVYRNMLETASSKGVSVSKVSAGKTYSLGDARFTVIAPSGSGYGDLNDYSVGIRLVYGSTSFVFTGDAEEISEQEMLRSGLTLSADVFKAGHHGSSSSNTSALLQEMDPEYVVISCGKDNEYGHPTEAVMQRFASQGVEVFRTDTGGTVLAESDGHRVQLRYTSLWSTLLSDIESGALLEWLSEGAAKAGEGLVWLGQWLWERGGDLLRWIEELFRGIAEGG